MPPRPRPKPKGKSVAVMSRSPVKAIDAIDALIARGRARAVTDTIVGTQRSVAMLGQAIVGKMLEGLVHMEGAKMTMADEERLHEILVNLNDSNTRAQSVLNQTPETQKGEIIEGEVISGAALAEFQEAYDALADRPTEGNG
jgi:hypothetical protein